MITPNASCILYKRQALAYYIIHKYRWFLRVVSRGSPSKIPPAPSRGPMTAPAGDPFSSRADGPHHTATPPQPNKPINAKRKRNIHQSDIAKHFPSLFCGYCTCMHVMSCRLRDGKSNLRYDTIRYASGHKLYGLYYPGGVIEMIDRC